MTAMNMAAKLAATATAQGWDERPAYLTPDRPVTHGRLHDLAARAAGVLAAHGIGLGDRLVIALPDTVAWPVTFLAAARLGATAVLLNPALPEDDHRFLAADSRAVLAVADDAVGAHFTGLAHLSGDRLLELAEHQDRWPAAEAGADHPLYIQYTSGTTGRPKGVVHRHRDPEIYYTGAGAQVLGIGADDICLSVSKLFFAYGLGNSLAFPLFSGGAAVLNPDRPHPARIAELVEKHQVTYLFAVPSAYANLLAEADPAAFRSVRAAVTAGERLTDELAERATAFLGAPLYNQLGSTEAGHAITTNGASFHVPGTIGRPVPGFSVEVRDASSGRPLPDGEPGELWVRGPSVTPGYLDRPEATSKALVGGWLNTRDRAVRNPDGTLVHLGRTDDLEMVGGITYSPVEVEQILARHPAVREVAVASVRDERGATRLRAFVVPRQPVADPEGLEAELLGLARASLAPYKVPRGVELVAALPHTSTGKLQRFLIRQGHW